MKAWSLTELESAKGIKKIFFYRVCGTGMGAAACLLKEKGFIVEGGDTNFYPPMSTYLEKSDIPLHKLKSLDSNFFKSFDLIVVGNVVSKGSENAIFIEGLGIPYVSFPTAIGALVLKDINVVGIAGTHGKTTTTYFMTQVLKKLRCEPGHFIGGVIDGMPSAILGDGKYFFIESDEYDSAYFEKISKFRQYYLNHMILTSLEFDHADIFNDIEDIKDQFRAALPQINGHIIADISYKHGLSLFSEKEFSKKDYTFYGNESGPVIEKEDFNGTKFSLIIDGKKENFETNLIGLHNILNLSSVILFTIKEKFKIIDVKKAVLSLAHVKRRQEVRGKFKEAIVIDDFAHHPRAVKMTIAAIKVSYPDRKICVVIEPNSATARSSLFQKEFEESLEEVDSLLFAKPLRDSSIKGTVNLDGEKIVKHLKNIDIKGKVVSTLQELHLELNKVTTENDLILVLSNGTCLGLWESDFVKELYEI